MEQQDWKTGWNNIDIPKKLSEHLKTCYVQGDSHLKDYKSEQIKKKFNSDLSKLLTKDLLIDLGVYEEVSSWIHHIQEKIAYTNIMSSASTESSELVTN